MDEVATPDESTTRVILRPAVALLVGIVVGVGVGIAVAAALTKVAKEYPESAMKVEIQEDDSEPPSSSVVIED